MRNRELTGRFIREKNVFGEGENRTVIAEVRVDKAVEIVRLRAAEGELQQGMNYRFFGHPKETKYGLQFQANSFAAEAPADDESFAAYLKQCSGPTKGSITDRVAWLLVETFGDRCVDVVVNRPAEAAAGLVGKGTRWDEEKALAASEYLRQFERVRGTKIQLLGLLDGRGFPKKTVDRAIRALGTDAATLIADDPYILTRFPGIGFQGADKMYCDLAKKNAANDEDYRQRLAWIKRQALCAAYAVRSDRSGSVWVARRCAELSVRKSIANTLARPDEAIQWAIAQGILVARKHGGDWLAITKLAEHELEIAKSINDLLMRDDVAWPADFSDIGNEHQASALATATSRRVGVLRGSPGTGKTYSVAFLIRKLIELYGENAVAIGCPTGKAAVRATQAMVASGVSVTATTIHRMLVVEKSEDGGWSFCYGAANPLPYRFIIVDECFPRGTMIDTPLGAIPIEEIQAGDEIENAIGRDRVLATHKKEVHRAIKITVREKEIVCSENHPIFTSRGVVLAGEIGPDDFIVHTTEAMRLLRNYSDTKEVGSNPLLLNSLLNEMVDAVPGIQSEDFHERTSNELRGGEKPIPQILSPRCHCSSRSHSEVESNAECHLSPALLRETQEHGAQTAGPGRQRQRTNEGRENVAFGTLVRNGCGMGAEFHREDGQRIPAATLQSRHCESGEEDRSRGGRGESQHDQSQSCGCKKNQVSGVSRVDCVEVLESGDIRLDQYRDADGKLYFYDLQATRHRSYSVSGFLVHNCSMVDTDLMASLLRACSEDCHVLFVGDAEQLAPVGPGRPFLDIQDLVPTGSLTEIRRNSGRIVRACAEIRDTRRFTPSKEYDEANGENLPWIECKEADLQETVMGLVQQIENGGDCDPIWDVQLLTACNQGSPVSRKVLNPLIQQLLNPNGQKCQGNPFRVGDKIVCLKNGGYWLTADFLKALQKHPSEVVGYANDRLYRMPDGQTLLVSGENNEVYVANGELAEVLSIDPGKMVVRLFDPSREVTVPYQPTRDGEQQADDESESESKGAVGDWDLGYVLTGHKGQGSQWQYVVWVCDPSGRAKQVQTRNLVYTNISRATKATFCIGEIAVANAACQRDGIAGRKTFLVERSRWDRAEKNGLIQQLREAV